MVASQPAAAGQSCTVTVNNQVELTKVCQVDTYDQTGHNSGIAIVTLDWEADGPGGSRRANVNVMACVDDTFTNGFGVRTIVNAHVAGTPTDNSGSYVTLGDAFSDGPQKCDTTHGASSANGFDFIYVNWGDAHTRDQYIYVGTEKILGP